MRGRRVGGLVFLAENRPIAAEAPAAHSVLGGVRGGRQMEFVTLLVTLLLTFALAAVSARQLLAAVFQLMQRAGVRTQAAARAEAPEEV